MRGTSGIGMGTTIKHLRRTTSGTAGIGLGATMEYLRRTTSAAAKNGMSITITPPFTLLLQRLLK
jgi:tRNA U55 pseudouridine synthase TruB